MRNEEISVLMLAYRHGPYVRQAIESVLAQRCDRPVTLWIGEDNSPDDTRAICQKLHAEHPDKIELFCSDESQGMHGNFSNLWKKSSGDWVAFCEGDDYWCDPLKLQKQINFLAAHPDCTLCGTFTDILKQSSAGEWAVSGQVRPPILKPTYSFEEMIPMYGFHFSSVLLRRDAVVFPDWFQQVYCVDRPLYLLATQNGLAGLIPETLSVYRLHPGGAWSTLGMCEKAERSIHLFETMIHYFSSRYRSKFRKALGNILWFYTGQALFSGDRAAARIVYRKCLRYLSFSHVLRHARQHISVGVRVAWPVGSCGQKGIER